jgi:Zn(2)-Cys(6) binuclear cluster domain-containing protein
MVYCGRPSSGCENCRYVRMSHTRRFLLTCAQETAQKSTTVLSPAPAQPCAKQADSRNEQCDEKRPACSRCVRKKQPCVGYRDLSGLIIRDETKRTKAKFSQWQPQPRGPIPTSEVTAVSGMGPAWLNIDPTVCRLPPAQEDIAVGYFYHTMMNTLCEGDPTRYLHLQLTKFYAQSTPGSAFRSATEAISYAASRHMMPRAALLCRKRYIDAVNAIRTAIQDPEEVRNDHTIYAILLLCGYEVSDQTCRLDEL